MQRLVHQTLYLSACHMIVRTIGFVMRIWLSRELGTLAMGLVELAQGAQMLLLSPVVSGLPSAISRICAREDTRGCQRILRMGIVLSLITSMPLMLLAFLLRTPLSQWLGDVRTIPSLLLFLPCLPVLGISCALNGYFYGIGKPYPPAMSELLEQIVRFLLCMRLVDRLSGQPVMLRAAIPAAGVLAGETAGLSLMLLFSARILLGRTPSQEGRSRRGILSELISLALPLTLMRMVSSLMRTATSTLLPKRLALSGLPDGEAISQLGIMQGMMMPILLLPSFITCSLSSVAAPEIARRQAQGKPLSSIARRSLGAAFMIGLAAMGGVWFLSPVIAHKLYRQMELLPMLRFSCFLIPVMAMTQVAGGLMNGLGLQAKSLKISIASGLACVLLTYILPAMPQLRIYGAILALSAGQGVTLVFSLLALKREISSGCISQ